jgi:hypothetical protein
MPMRPFSEVTMLAIEFWIVRKGDDPWKVAPEVGDGLARSDRH